MSGGLLRGETIFCHFAKYGDTWVEKLKNYSFISKFCYISDMIRFMVKEGDKIIKETVHEDGFLIVHDALLLMTVKTKITWMHKNNHLP